MAAHGVARATLDTDLLVVDDGVLDRALWSAAMPAEVSVELRVGGSDDPVAGLVRFSHRMEVVDLVVGRGAWQRAIVTRARPLTIGEDDVHLVELADLVLLKLYAGGPQDLLDVRLLLDGAEEAIAQQIEDRVAAAPRVARENWDALRRERKGRRSV